MTLAMTWAMTQPVSAADLSPEARADIRHLLEITGASNLGDQMAADTTDQLVQLLKAANPQMPKRAFDVVNREVTAVVTEQMSAPGGFLDQIVTVYGKNFTSAEIRELIAFYESPVGKKTVSTMTQVMGESMAIRQKWGQTIVPEIDRRVTDALGKEGLLPKQAPSPGQSQKPEPAPKPAQSPEPEQAPKPN